MKKIIFLLLVALFGCSAMNLMAQTEKGSRLLGGTTSLAPGSAGFRFSNSKAKIINGPDFSDTKSYGLNISPSLGYFVADNLAVGVGLGIAFNGYKSGNADTEWENTLSFSPFMRYYLPVSNKVKPYGEAGFSFFSTKSAFSNDDERSGSRSIGGGVGTAFFIGPKTSLDLLLRYDYLFSRDEITLAGNPVRINYSTSIIAFNIGFSFFL